MMRVSSVKVRRRQDVLPSRLRRLSSMWLVAQTPDVTATTVTVLLLSSQTFELIDLK